MAIYYDSLATKYSEHVFPPIVAAPLSFSAWVEYSTLTTQGIMTLANSNTPNDRFQIATGSSGSVSVTTTAGGTTGTATTATGLLVANRWAHVCGVWLSAASRSVYVNGGGKATNTTSLTPSGIDTCRLGVRWATSGGTAERVLAQPWFFASALTDGEVVALARGAPPWTIRPHSGSFGWLFSLLHPGTVELAYGSQRPVRLTPVAAPQFAQDPPWLSRPLPPRRVHGVFGVFPRGFQAHYAAVTRAATY